MSSNTSPLDQNVFDPQVAAEQREQRKAMIQSSWQSVIVKKSISLCRFLCGDDWSCICCFTVR
jgi:hypothetical protein